MVPIQQHESNYTLELVRQTQRNRGPEQPIRVLDDASASFALFHFEELLTLRGHPPAICLAIHPMEVSRRYAA